MNPPRITLLTDFGTADGYVAALKGVIASTCAAACIDDASHDIEPGDIMGAALALERYWRLYPPGTVHVVVVDPGVGSERRALAVRADERFLVGPDNGVFSRALAGAGAAEARELVPSVLGVSELSATFHGRDLFAPAAAQLANGREVAELGPHAANLVRLPALEVMVQDQTISGQVIHVDRFGNLISNIGAEAAGAAHVRVSGSDVGPVRRTYADAGPGELIALIGSGGLLEIAVRDGSAARRLNTGRGSAVQVER